jgi:hypothetical protein
MFMWNVLFEILLKVLSDLPLREREWTKWTFLNFESVDVTDVHKYKSVS